MSTARFACALSFAMGFLSLSQEILFVRLVGFAHQSTPEAFAFVLVFFLLGIAGGARIGKRLCATRTDLRRHAGIVLLGAGTLDCLVPWLAVGILARPAEWATLAIAMLILVVAAAKSVVFPIAHQLGADPGKPRIGTSISRVYASNILGSTLGPLVTGFVLLDVVTLEHAFVLVGFATLATGMVAAGRRTMPWSAAIAVLSAAVIIYPADMLRSIVAAQLKAGESVGALIERRSGIVHTVGQQAGGDSVYGGNVYDGRINTSLRVNSNGIDRAYVLATLHPDPERVLVIGMSSGAWTRVLAGFPGVRRIDVVEINPAYLELVQRYAEVAGILSDPKIVIHIDDGRRWLERHPHERYDLIVMNTTFHWRAYSTNLLSRQFLQLARRHLRENGILSFNTTGSFQALWTAHEVFPFVRRFGNFAYASDHDFVAGMRDRAPRLLAMLDRNEPENLLAVGRMLEQPFLAPETIHRHTGAPMEVVTDENMLTEYRFGLRGLLIPQLF